MEDDIPAVRRLMWGLVTATLLIAATFSARLYFSLGSAGEDISWLESTAVIGALLGLSLLAAGVSGHLTRLKQMEETDARHRLRKRMAELNRKEEHAHQD